MEPIYRRGSPHILRRLADLGVNVGPKAMMAALDKLEAAEARLAEAQALRQQATDEHRALLSEERRSDIERVLAVSPSEFVFAVEQRGQAS